MFSECRSLANAVLYSIYSHRLSARLSVCLSQAGTVAKMNPAKIVRSSLLDSPIIPSFQRGKVHFEIPTKSPAARASNNGGIQKSSINF